MYSIQHDFEQLPKNLAKEQTGLFTREVMSLLEAQEDLLPDYLKLTEQLMTKFDELRNEGKTEQTPSYWFRDWKGNILSTKQPNSIEEGIGEYWWIDEFKKFPSMGTYRKRKVVFESLPDDTNIKYNIDIGELRGAPNEAVPYFVRRCYEMDNGMEELIKAVGKSDKGTKAFTNFIQKLKNKGYRVGEG